MIDRLGGQALPAATITTTVQGDTDNSNLAESTQSRHTEEMKVEVVPKDKLEKIIDSMNEFVAASNTHLKFEFHDKLNEYYVTVVDDTTQEVVKEIPSKKMLDMYAAMTEFLGVMVDKKI
ncbi:flagellar protein FlaG [Heyndrickxia sporothermodurans]|uniref:Flagellar protein FlaG n=1 Tax=Heyndrickxia sporothermodurans TaxID=46224 RepID=A0A150KKM7_9BACI|nr:flagellar protein FlaG [Heyndrickxia sporothermodurans]KYC88608.1 hypothetical protein B4102_3997 [Heyndrickxia sporothermodurans]MBL5767289.1 flagellar protein FlaG [Heyndrickxia sporothermodurans]MBL5770824.1 flagellar protein FlaG [Heyndrickxia sporothermodurans]MBL5774590.1 flagellar protein FlaG [Heyndrickxia sporothermodurans]MBL5777902.1 flagellar protein FlaG [Heyndrickxia sporothermodurans]